MSIEDAAEGVKLDDEKTRWDVMPWEALEEVARVMTFGAQKYAKYNFRKGFKTGRLFSAALRHLWAWQRGEDLDPESGLPHLSHAAASIMMLRDIEIIGSADDDRDKISNVQTDRSLIDKWIEENYGVSPRT